MSGLLAALALLFALAGVALGWAGVAAFRRRRAVGSTLGLLTAALALSLAALFTTLAVATQGYRALTREHVAAVVTTKPEGPQRFTAHVEFPDGRDTAFTLSGDEVYVDAHILKWKPIANLLGLHTAYELDRIAGRYAALGDEQAAPRSVHGLATDKPFDLFTLRRRYALFAPLVDAEYGSATYVAAARGGSFEVRVSTTGLLIRPLEKAVP